MPEKNDISPKGFLFSAAEAAIKRAGRKDLALIYSEKEAVMAGVFTTNRVKAAPVGLDMRRIKSGKGRAIIANSGNANACTGKRGMEDALEMTRLVAEGLGVDERKVYVCSTGVIGSPMPMDRIKPEIAGLVRGIGSGTVKDAALAVMTTDTFPKIASREIRIGTKRGVITGICKGAGMIAPKMATMLCFIMTDLAVEGPALDRALRETVEKSFNRLTIDGDMSTNDTVLIMANGMAGNAVIREKSDAYRTFSSVLSGVCYELSRMVAKDGEGATKLLEIEVKNARTEKDAEKAAFAIANSLLVKTASYGNDANWGRIMAALGYSGASIREERIDIILNGLTIVRRGMGTGKDREAGERMKGKEIAITVDLHLGRGSAKVLTCDLSEDYVKVNAEYRT